MTKNSRHELRKLLNRRSHALIDEAVRTGGAVSQEEVDAVGRLQKLIDLPDAAPHGQQWILPVALLLTLIVVTVLLFTHIASSEIELQVTVSEVSFRLPQPQVLTDDTEVTRIDAAGLRRIQLPGDQHHSDQAFYAPEGDVQSVRLEAGSESGRERGITLSGIQAPASTLVTVRYAGVPNRFRFGLKAKDLNVHADVQGSILAKVSSGAQQTMTFPIPKPVDMLGGDGQIDLVITFRDSEQGAVVQQLEVDQLSFVHIDERPDNKASLVRRLSSIASGTLYIESLNGQKDELRSGELLELEQPGGHIRAVRLNKDQIFLRFHGRIANIWAGSGESRRTLMPTLLEWTRAQHGVGLMWGTTLYVFGMIGGLFRWLKISE